MPSLLFDPKGQLGWVSYGLGSRRIGSGLDQTYEIQLLGHGLRAIAWTIRILAAQWVGSGIPPPPRGQRLNVHWELGFQGDPGLLIDTSSPILTAWWHKPFRRSQRRGGELGADTVAPMWLLSDWGVSGIGEAHSKAAEWVLCPPTT